MVFWRLKYSALPISDRKNVKVFSAFAVLFIVSCLYFLLVLTFDQIPNTDELRKKFVLNGSLSDVIPFKILGTDNDNANTRHHIAIVLIVTKDTRPENYDIAMQTVRCYCKIHGYEFVLAVDTDFNCKHHDKFFRRHCAAAKILPLFDAILFLDADIGVVNPKRKIEEFMTEGIDVTFYDRFYNWEIMAGSYIAKNTKYSIDLLNDFADYEFKLPNSFHGTDNGALHLFLAEKLLLNADIQIEICRKVYKKSQDYDDLFTYEACIRALFGVRTDFGKVRIMKKGTGWARDGWLTSMLWNPEMDFMFHGWKTNQLRETPKNSLKPVRMGSSQWYNPLGGPIHLSKCSSSNMTWSYDPKLIADTAEVRKGLKKFEEQIAVDQVNSYSRMTGMLIR